MLQHTDVIQKIGYVNKETGVSVVMFHYPTFLDFKDLMFCFNVCTFAKSIYSLIITISIIIKSFFSFSTPDLRSVHDKTYSLYHKKPSGVKKLIELIRNKEDKADLN